MRGLPFDWKVEALLEGSSDVALIVRPMLVRLATTAQASRYFRQDYPHLDKGERHVPAAHERACHRRIVRPRMCQHRGRSGDPQARTWGLTHDSINPEKRHKS
jgi:hypothetical protein